jgi:hypothetical protein
MCETSGRNNAIGFHFGTTVGNTLYVDDVTFSIARDSRLVSAGGCVPDPVQPPSCEQTNSCPPPTDDPCNGAVVCHYLDDGVPTDIRSAGDFQCIARSGASVFLTVNPDQCLIVVPEFFGNGIYLRVEQDLSNCLGPEGTVLRVVPCSYENRITDVPNFPNAVVPQFPIRTVVNNAGYSACLDTSLTFGPCDGVIQELWYDPLNVLVVNDLVMCPSCSGPNNPAWNLATDWRPEPYKGSAIAKARTYQVPEPFVYGIFVQESSGSFVTQNANTNRIQLLSGMSASVGASNISEFGVRDIRRNNPSYKAGKSDKDVLWEFVGDFSFPIIGGVGTWTPPNPDTVADATAQRIKYRLDYIMSEIAARKVGVITNASAAPASARKIYLSALLGRAYNADPSTPPPLNVVTESLRGNWPASNASNDAIKNLGAAPGEYFNGYTQQYRQQQLALQ